MGNKSTMIILKLKGDFILPVETYRYKKSYSIMFKKTWFYLLQEIPNKTEIYGDKQVDFNLLGSFLNPISISKEWLDSILERYEKLKECVNSKEYGEKLYNSKN